MTVTDIPDLARISAAINPAGPAPATITFLSISGTYTARAVIAKVCNFLRVARLIRQVEVGFSIHAVEINSLEPARRNSIVFALFGQFHADAPRQRT